MMKTFASILLVMFSASAFSQSGYNAPNDVRESFHRDYPKSQPGTWNNVGKEYTVKFDDRDNDNGESVAYYKSDGGRIATHTRYDNNDVPAPIMNHMKKHYSGSDNYRVTRIDRHSGPDLYEVDYTRKNAHHKIYVDEHGKEHQYHHGY